jgi:hypothetical protein
MNGFYVDSEADSPRSWRRGGYLMMLFCVLILGCTTHRLEFEISELHRGFFRIPYSGQSKMFHRLDLETQYELYIMSIQYYHPPYLYLVDELAKRGKEIVPLLCSKLTTTKREITVRDIVSLLFEMQHSGTYDVRSDVELMALVEKRVSAMQGIWRPMAKGDFESIRRGDANQRTQTPSENR